MHVRFVYQGVRKYSLCRDDTFFSFSPYIGIGAKSQNRPKIDKTRLCIAKYTIYIL